MDPFGLAMVALKEWFEKQMGYVSDTYGGEGSLYWDTDARIAYVSMSGNGYEGYAEFAPGVAGSYIDPTNNRLYVEEALLWAVFGRIIDPPLQTDWIFNITLFAGSSLVAHTGLTATGLIGAEAAGTIATATVTTTSIGPIMSAADAAKIIVAAEQVGSAAIRSDAYHRAASFLTQSQLANGTTSLFRCSDGVFRTMLVVKDVVVNGARGFVEFIIDANGTITHQLFRAY